MVRYPCSRVNVNPYLTKRGCCNPLSLLSPISDDYFTLKWLRDIFSPSFPLIVLKTKTRHLPGVGYIIVVVQKCYWGRWVQPPLYYQKMLLLLLLSFYPKLIFLWLTIHSIFFPQIRPEENRMFPQIFWSKTNFVISLGFYQFEGLWRHSQWRSQGLPGRACRPPGEPKWGRKWERFEEKWEKMIEIWGGKWKKLNFLPTRDCEAGYGSGHNENC